MPALQSYTWAKLGVLLVGSLGLCSGALKARLNYLFYWSNLLHTHLHFVPIVLNNRQSSSSPLCKWMGGWLESNVWLIVPAIDWNVGRNCVEPERVLSISCALLFRSANNGIICVAMARDWQDVEIDIYQMNGKFNGKENLENKCDKRNGSAPFSETERPYRRRLRRHNGSATEKIHDIDEQMANQ